MKLTWNLIGQFLGYPKCCIESFENQCRSELQFEAANGTGFVPCEKHAKQVLSGEKKLKNLIKNRVFSVPFPAEGGHDQIINECRRYYNDPV